MVYRFIYGPSMLLAVPYLVFSSTLGTGTFSYHIDDFPRWFVDHSTDCRSFRRPKLSQNSPSCLQMHKPPIDVHHLWFVGDITGRRWPSWLESALHFHNLLRSVLDNFPAKQRQKHIKITTKTL